MRTLELLACDMNKYRPVLQVSYYVILVGI